MPLNRPPGPARCSSQLHPSVRAGLVRGLFVYSGGCVIGKASARRRKRRQEFLGKLAAKSPDEFRREWSKRLESWGREASRRAGRLLDEDGATVPPAFDVVDHAEEELAGCGESAEALEGEATREVLTDQCCEAAAQTEDYRMYRLSNARSNHEKMKNGAYRPPR